MGSDEIICLKAHLHKAERVISTQQIPPIITQRMQEKKGILQEHLAPPPYFTNEAAWPKEMSDRPVVVWFLAELALESGCSLSLFHLMIKKQ